MPNHVLGTALTHFSVYRHHHQGALSNSKFLCNNSNDYKYLIDHSL